MNKNKLLSESTGYSVLLTNIINKHKFLAHDVNGRFFAEKYKDAVTYRDELQKHLKSKGKIVKVKVKYYLE